MEALTEKIQHNLTTVQNQIASAARSVDRSPDDVRLVVVTKAQPVEVLQSVIEAGAAILGENYPEETVPKIEALGHPVKVAWHMIGHLQSRKAALVADEFDMLQSLDSLKLAERLERLMVERERVLPVLLEFNVGGEASKYGWQAQDESHWPDLYPDIARLLELKHLSVRGLMTMPPLFDDPEQARPFFASLRRLRDYLAEQFPQATFYELSMGTSADFTAAIQEGATLVRVGRAIVGPRPEKL